MKKPSVIFCAFVALIVSFNLLTREGQPEIEFSAVLELQKGGWGDAFLNFLLTPGAYVLWYLGFDPDTPAEILVALLVSWWFWPTSARTVWSALGRRLGFYSISAFHRWSRFAFPWRPTYLIWLRFLTWAKHFGHGTRATAGWAATLTVYALLYRPGNSIYLGRAMFKGIGLYQPVGVDGEGHAMLIGNTGSGKTRFLMGWMGSLHRDASAFIIDAGGQASNALARPLLTDGHHTYVWDAYHQTKFESASWNLLDEFTLVAKRHGVAAVVRYAKVAATAIVKDLNERQQIFSEGGRDYLLGDLVKTWLYEPPERRNLVRVRANLTTGRPDLVTDPKQDPFDAHLDDMLRVATLDDGCGGAINAVIARGASVMKSGKTREGNPFRTSVIVATSFIDVPEVAATLLRSDFTIERLKTHNDCLFIAAPVDDIRGTLSGFMRLLSAYTAYTFQHIKFHRKIPCAMFIDEAPSIAIEDLDTGAAHYRKHGIRLVVVTQDLPLLEKAYPQGWKTLMGSAAVRIWLTNGELSTLKYLGEELGVRTILESIGGSSLLSKTFGAKELARAQSIERPLAYLQQLRDFLDRDAGYIIVTRTGKPPLRLKYDGYDSSLAVWEFDADPNYEEPALRSIGRNVMTWAWVPKPKPGSPRLRLRVKEVA